MKKFLICLLTSFILMFVCPIYGETDNRVLLCSTEHVHIDSCYRDFASANVINSFTNISWRKNGIEVTDFNSAKWELTDTITLHLVFSVNKDDAATNPLLKIGLPSSKISFDNVYGKDVTTGGNTVFGKYSIIDNKLYFEFDSDWLSGIASGTSLNIAFNVNGRFSLDDLDENGKVTIPFEGNNFTFDFTNDVFAKNVPFVLDKSLSESSYYDSKYKLVEENGNIYIEYKLKLNKETTDKTFTIPNVQVIDYLIQGSAYFDAFCLTDGTEITMNPLAVTNGTVYIGKLASDSEDKRYVPVSDGEQGVLVWDLENITNGRDYELTYRVKLKNEYAKANKNSTDEIVNKAEFFSKQFKQESEGTTVFTPKATLNITKSTDTDTGISTSENGNVIIPYKVVVSAPADNSYTLKSVRLDDNIAYGGYSKSTAEKYRQYISYDKDSFKINGVSVNSDSIISVTNGIYLNAGDFAPGESKVISYNLVISEELFTRFSDPTIQIGNTARVSDSFNNYIEQYGVLQNIENKTWSRKSHAVLNTDETVSVGSDSFTASAGSFKYTVYINEDGKWNVNYATFEDAIDNPSLLTYIGYAKVEAFDMSGITFNKEDVESNFTNLVSTGYVEIEGKSSFTFIPKDIMIASEFDSDKPYAYRLTYYGEPHPGVTDFEVNNSFRIKGRVISYGSGVGSGYTHDYDFNLLTAEHSATISANSSFTSSKTGWYYTNPDNNYATDSLYWVIEVNGGGSSLTLPAGFEVIDTPRMSTHGGNHACHVETYSGVYVLRGKVNPMIYKDVDSIDLTKYQQVLFTKTINNAKISPNAWRELVVKLTDEVSLAADESLYYIIETKPSHDSAIVQNKWVSYVNDLQYSQDGAIRSTIEEAKFVVEENDSIHKTHVFSFDFYNGTYKNPVWKNGYGTDYVKIDELCNGSYFGWEVKVNPIGLYSGEVIVEEEIPNELELVYIGYGNTGIYDVKPVVKPYNEAGWSTNGLSDTNERLSKIPYSVKDNKVRFVVSGLEKIEDIDNLGDSKCLRLIVVCRVKNVFAPGSQDIMNRVNLYRSDLTYVGSAQNTVTYQSNTINKELLSLSASSECEFKISVNPLAEDLIPGASYITLVDKLSEPLSFKTSSIKIYTDAACTVQYAGTVNKSLRKEGNEEILELTIPDNITLYIKYSTVFTCNPGDTIITNKAGWMGYAPMSGPEMVAHTYQIDASVSVSDNPKITIIKSDANNIDTKISDVKFEIIAKKSITESSFNAVSDKSGMTDANGELQFANLDPDTYYVLKESENQNAGFEYIVDPDYRAVVFLKKDASGNYPACDNTVEYGGQNITVQKYYTNDAVIEWPNSKSSITFDKQFKNSGDSALLWKIDYTNMKLKDSTSSMVDFSGSFVFGLFKDENDSFIRRLTLTINHGTVTIDDGTRQLNSLTFNNLGSGTYSIYEMNGDEKITGTSNVILNNLSFDVDYDKCQDITVNGTSENGVTRIITNTSQMFELPESGSTGQLVFKLVAIFCLTIGIVLVIRGRNE